MALDSETTAHANLATLPAEQSKMSSQTNITAMNDSAELLRTSSETALQTKVNASEPSTPRKSKESQHDLARKAFLLGQSEERVQALSVIMLHLCTGLQYAQGVANQ